MTQTRVGPEFTPWGIRFLIFITCLVSILCALTVPIMTNIYGLPGAGWLLSLSWTGYQSYYYWQLFSYLFVENGNLAGITFFFLLTLAFDMYILWVMGTSILESVGTAPFMRFYFLSGLMAAIAALIAMGITGQHPILSGPTPAILALLMVWAMKNPENELMLYFLIPVKAKWLMAIIVGSILLINLSQLAWVSLAFYVAGPLFGYAYAVLFWEMEGPFAFTKIFDKILDKFGSLIRTGKNKAKIFDIRTGEPPLDDEAFIDAMLAKIARKGEQSLTWNERKRLDAISTKKRKH